MRDKPPPDNELPTVKDTNQTRTVGMPLESSDFDKLDQKNPFVRMESNPCGGKPYHGEMK